jgi:hypothetical protein
MRLILWASCGVATAGGSPHRDRMTVSLLLFSRQLIVGLNVSLIAMEHQYEIAVID